MDNLKIAIAQMTSIDDVNQNLNIMMDLISQLSPSQVDVVFFPENCLYMRLAEGEDIPGLELSDAAFPKLLAWSQSHKIHLHLGSVPLRVGQDLRNSSIWISPEGTVKPSYTKTHLFDIELTGQAPIRESDVFLHGNGPTLLSLKNWNIGQTICYDLRFSELFHSYAMMGVEVITVPAAFLVKTGQAHWEVLLRARAIESQCYIVASAQCGLHRSPRGQRETFGHSLVIDPWGQKLVEMGNRPGLQVVDLQLDEVRKVRQQIPMKNHRRGPFPASNK